LSAICRGVFLTLQRRQLSATLKVLNKERSAICFP